MEFMTWTSDLSVGVAVLDDDHKRLIGIINQLHYGIKAGHDRDVLEAVLANWSTTLNSSLQEKKICC